MAKQVEQLEKEKKELQERLKNQEKKVQFPYPFIKYFISNNYIGNCLKCQKELGYV